MVNWRSRGDWDTYSANLRNALNIAPRDLDLGMTKTARKFSSSQDIMETLIHITDSYNWSEVGFGSSLWVSIALVWAPCHWDVVVICAVLLLRTRPLIKSVSFAREESSWIYWADVYSHRAVVCRCTVPEEEDDDEGINSLCRQIVGTDKNLDISTLITRGCFFGTYYLTASTLPLGLATTWWIWTLPTCFPTALCMCMVWWKCRYSQPGRFEWLCKDFFYNTFCFVWCDCINLVQTVFFFDKWAHGCRGSVADFAVLSRWTFHVSFSTDQLWVGGIPI